MALIPAPPMPTMWIRWGDRGRARSALRRHRPHRPVSGHGRPPARPPGPRRRGGRARPRPRAWLGDGRGRKQAHRARPPAGGRRIRRRARARRRPIPTRAWALRGLVVAGRPGQGHEDGGHAGDGQLGHRHGAGLGTQTSAARVELGHAVLVGHDPVAQSLASLRWRPAAAERGARTRPVVPPPGDVVERAERLAPGPPGPRPGLGHGPVDPPRARASRRRRPRSGGPAGRPSAARPPGPALGRPVQRASSPRTGVPVTCARGSSVPGKATALAAAKRPRRPLTAPGTASVVTETSGTRVSTAASPAGKLA